jgi:hypothetical protein
VVGLQGGDHVADPGVLALGDELHAAHRGAEHRQAPETLDGLLETVVRRGFGQVANHHGVPVRIGGSPGCLSKWAQYPHVTSPKASAT